MNSIDFRIPTQFSYNNEFLNTIFTSLTFNNGENIIYSKSDEAEDERKMIDERKRRRMISNKESAKRSRMRKQGQADELLSQMIKLRNDNQSLISKLNQAYESHGEALKENERLKKEAAELHETIISHMINLSG